MANDDSAMSEGASEEAAAPAAAMMTALSSADRLMGLGALLIILVSDLLGDILLDKYSISNVTWILAIGVVAAIWIGRMANKALPLPYRSVLVLLGYATFVMAAREFLADIDGTFLGSSNIVYALALYAGGILLAIGAYQAARSE